MASSPSPHSPGSELKKLSQVVGGESEAVASAVSKFYGCLLSGGTLAAAASTDVRNPETRKTIKRRVKTGVVEAYGLVYKAVVEGGYGDADTILKVMKHNPKQVEVMFTLN